MKIKILIISIFYAFTSVAMYSQTYDLGDKAALLAIDNSCDMMDQLNWDTEADLSKWDGVVWDNSSVKRVVTLNLINKSLSDSMDVSDLTHLVELHCYLNQLTGINVSGLTNLKVLLCDNNLITSLDVSGLTMLTTLSCSSNDLDSLDISGLTGLNALYCSANQFTTLNLSGLSNLKTLHCISNQLTSLDLSGLTNLNELNCYSNSLTSITVTGLTKLKKLNCNNNQLTSLDVSGLISLSELNCYSNQLTSLDVSSLDSLSILKCDNNQLTELDVSGLTSLLSLSCGYNSLTSLSLSGLTNLSYLTCHYNQLSDIDLSGMINLSTFMCFENKFPFTVLANGINVSSYDYTPQKMIYDSVTTSENVVLDYSAEALILDSATTFMFHKNNVLVEENTTGMFTTNGGGEYFCEMTNGRFPGLILTTAPVIVSMQELTVSDTSLFIGYAEGSTTDFIISSNTSWNISCSETWLSANPSSGSDNNMVTLTAEANTSVSPRSAIVTVSGDGIVSQIISVTQSALATAGIVNQSLSDPVIYPNPVADILHIDQCKGKTLKIYDLSGVKLFSKPVFIENETIDISGLSPAMYILSVDNYQAKLLKK